MSGLAAETKSMSIGNITARLTGQTERPVGACKKCGHGGTRLLRFCPGFSTDCFLRFLFNRSVILLFRSFSHFWRCFVVHFYLPGPPDNLYHSVFLASLDLGLCVYQLDT